MELKLKVCAEMEPLLDWLHPTCPLFFCPIWPEQSASVGVWEGRRAKPKTPTRFLVVFNCPVIQGLDECLKSVPETASQTLKQQKTLGFPEQRGFVIRWNLKGSMEWRVTTALKISRGSKNKRLGMGGSKEARPNKAQTPTQQHQWALAYSWLLSTREPRERQERIGSLTVTETQFSEVLPAPGRLFV